MIHLYYGDGKGKTTAACGLCVRAAGSGMAVLFAQFFKSGASSEVAVLSSLPGIKVLHPSIHFGRYRTLTEEQKEKTRESYREMMETVERISPSFALVVLDEAVSAFGYGMVEREGFLSFLRREGERRELVLTGRMGASPEVAAWTKELLALADYATEMRKEKHPFDRGIAARRGIEY